MYKIAANIQLILWVFGINLHNKFKDECTPDFGCCNKIKTPFERRVKLYKKYWLSLNKNKFTYEEGRGNK